MSDLPLKKRSPVIVEGTHEFAPADESRRRRHSPSGMMVLFVDSQVSPESQVRFAEIRGGERGWHGEMIGLNRWSDWWADQRMRISVHIDQLVCEEQRLGVLLPRGGGPPLHRFTLVFAHPAC